MDSVYFYYNTKKSSDMEIYLVSIEKGMKSTPFLAEKEVISETIPNSDFQYIYGAKRKPLVFNLTLSTLEGYWTFEKRRELARWLSTDTFEKFYSGDNPEKIYFLQYIGGVDLTHNSNQQGWIQIQMLSNSPYAYSDYQTQIHDLSSITSPTIINFSNKGDNALYPEMWIQKIGAGDISIKNLTNSGKEFKFTGLLDNETVYIDNRPQHRHIETDLANTYRYDNFNGNYLDLLPYSMNRLEITGKCKITFRYQFEIKG